MVSPPIDVNMTIPFPMTATILPADTSISDAPASSPFTDLLNSAISPPLPSTTTDIFSSESSPPVNQPPTSYYYSPPTESIMTANALQDRQADEGGDGDLIDQIKLPTQERQSLKIAKSDTDEDPKSATNKHRFMRFTP